MFLDDVDNLAVQTVFKREIDPFLYVGNDDERAHGWREIVVRIALKIHVLGVILRLYQLADVMEVGADSAKGRVCADGFGSGFGQIGDDEAMVIGARSFDCHSSKKRMVEVRGLEP